MLARFFQTLVHFPKIVILVSLLLTGFFVYKAGQELFDDNLALKIDNGIEPFMAQDSENFHFYKVSQELFASSDALIFSVTPKEGNFDLDFFNTLDAFTKELIALESVDSATNLLNAPNPSGACQGKSYFHKQAAGSECVSYIEEANQKLACIASQEFVKEDNSFGDDALDEGLDEDFESDFEADSSDDLDAGLDEDFDSDIEDEAVAAVAPTFVCTQSIASMTPDDVIEHTNDTLKTRMKAVAEDSFLQKDIISVDGTKSAMFVNFVKGAKTNEATVQDAIEAVVAKYQADNFQIGYAGPSREEYTSSRVLSNDMRTILPLSLVLMAMVLLFSFKSIRGVLIPFGIVVIGIVWTFGLFAVFGEELNLVSMILPPLLVSVGSAYIIHVLNHYYHEMKTGTLQEAIDATLAHTAIPMVVTAFTTISGFAALALSPIPAIVQMGVYASLGIAIVVFLSLVLAPSVLMLLKPPKQKPKDKKEEEKADTIVDKLLAKKASIVGRFSRQFIIMWVMVVAVALLGTVNLSFNSGGSTFNPKMEIVKDLKYIEDNFAGTSTIRVILSGDNLQSAKTILGIEKIKHFLQESDSPISKINDLRVDKIYSPVEYLSHHRQGLDNLKDKEVVNFFIDLEKLGGPSFLSEDKNYMQFTIRMTIDGSTAFLELKKLLDKELEETFTHLKVQLTGSAILTSESNDNIAKGQVQSIIMALGIIFVVLSALFFSFKMGFLALYPNIAAIGLFFGILGWFDIPISVTISVIAAIALGIGVDDTIHFLSHYNEEVKMSRDEKASSLATLRLIGRPMIFTSVTLTLGFIVFAFSDMQSQVLFGLFTAMTLFICLITDLNFLPSIMAETKLITIWDYVGLEFNEKFIKKIAIFRNMNVKETKLATLMAYTIDAKKDEYIFKEGDVSNEMYIVLKGNVDIYLDEELHGKNIHLAQLPQNSLFGEMGLFRHATRSATAQATEDSQLLVLNDQVLKSIQKRYPKISKKLFQNLSRRLLLSIIKSNFMIQENADLSSHKLQLDEQFSSIFDGMSDSEQSWILKRCEIKTFEPKEDLFYIGQTGDFMAIILEGAFDVTLEEDYDDKVHTLQVGDIVGETLIISDNTRRTATVTANQNSKVAIMSKEMYEDMMHSKDALASKFNYNMVCLLSDRLQHNNCIMHG